MKSRLLMGLVVALLGSGAYAQSVINLNPGAFAPGTDVSNAFAGATLSTMSLASDGIDPGTGLSLWTPVYAPVYANGSFFADSATPALGPWENSADWAISTGEPTSGDCFKVCAGGNGFGNFLLVSFASPVSFARPSTTEPPGIATNTTSASETSPPSRPSRVT